LLPAPPLPLWQLRGRADAPRFAHGRPFFTLPSNPCGVYAAGGKRYPPSPPTSPPRDVPCIFVLAFLAPSLPFWRRPWRVQLPDAPPPGWPVLPAGSWITPFRSPVLPPRLCLAGAPGHAGALRWRAFLGLVALQWHALVAICTTMQSTGWTRCGPPDLTSGKRFSATPRFHAACPALRTGFPADRDYHG